jgi:hypothetical protein
VYRVLSGLRGDIDRWHWESTVTWARNEGVERASDQLATTLSLRSGLRLTVAIENLGDTDPPRINRSSTANTDHTIYRCWDARTLCRRHTLIASVLC